MRFKKEKKLTVVNKIVKTLLAINSVCMCVFAVKKNV